MQLKILRRIHISGVDIPKRKNEEEKRRRETKRRNEEEKRRGDWYDDGGICPSNSEYQRTCPLGVKASVHISHVFGISKREAFLIPT